MTGATVSYLPPREASGHRTAAAPAVAARGRGGLLGAALTLVAVGGCALNGVYDVVAWHVAGLVLTCVLGAATVAGRIALPRTAVAATAAWAAFCLWTAASTHWSLAPSRSWAELDRALLYLVFTVLAVGLLRHPRARAAALAAAGLGTGVLLAATFAWGLLTDPSALFVLKRLASPVGYINGVAGLAVIGFWPSVALAERTDRPRLAGAGAASAVVLLGAMLLTQSRSVVPALLLSAALVATLVPGRRTRLIVLVAVGAAALAVAPAALGVFAHDRSRPFAAADATLARHALVLVLAVAALAGVFWAGVAAWLRGDARRLRVASTVLAVVLVAAIAAGTVVRGPAAVHRAHVALDDFRSLRVDEGTTSRFASGGGNRHELWRVAIAAWRDRPVTGIGAGAYGVRWYQQRRVTEAIRQPHNLPLQVLAELGLVGLGLLVATFAAVAFAALRAVRRARTAADRALVAGAIGAVAAWSVHTSLDWLYNVPAVTGVALVCVAALLTAGARRREDADEATPAAPAGLARRARAARVAAVAALAGVAASLSVGLAVHGYTSRAEARVATDPVAARDLARKATRLDGGDVPAWIALAAAEARLGSYARSDAALRRIVTAEPASYVGYALRGDLATRAGLTGRAHALYTAAARRNPLDAGLAERVAATAPGTASVR